MKKLSIIIICVLLVSLLAVPVLAAQSANMSVSVSNKTLYRGDTVTVTVSTSKVDNCVSGGFMFSYDKNVFEYVSGSATLSGYTAGVSTAAGNVAGYFMNGNATVQGSIFQITLKVKDTAAVGTYTISGVPSLTDADSAVSCSAGSASVTVACHHSYGSWTEADSGHQQTCQHCGDVKTEDHKWDKGSETKTATCKEEGVKTYTCTVCNATKTEAIPKTDDHVFGNLTAVDGSNHKDTCSVCQKEITEGHKWDSGKVTKPATCKEEGEKTYTCTGCQYSKTEKLPLTDHSWGKWQNVDEENHKHTCTVCTKEETAGHNWNKGVVTKKATCKEEGEKTYTCTDCGATKVEKLPISDVHSWSKWAKVDADTHKRSCSVCEKEETGNHSYNSYWSKDRNNHYHECSVCKDQKDVEKHTPGPEATETTAQTCTVCKYIIKAALGHTHNYAEEWTTDEAGHWYTCAGCEEKGSYADHDFENVCDPDCSICGYTRETAHDYGDNWVTDKDNHWHVCTGCGDIQDQDAHIPGPAATETDPQTCTICGYELAPALGISETEPEVTETEPVNMDEPKNDFPWWIIIVAVVVIGGAAVFVIIKKKQP